MSPSPRIQDIVVIGPPNVGKTTVSALLAERLGVEHHELDRLRLDYFKEMGFDMPFNLRLYEEHGADAMMQYWGVFAPYAIERFFEDCSGVLDLGGGSPVAFYPPLMDRIEAAFRPFVRVVLLLPDPDVEVSLDILGRRQDAPAEVRRSQQVLMEHGALQRLATHVVYTRELGPDDVANRVLNVL